MTALDKAQTEFDLLAAEGKALFAGPYTLEAGQAFFQSYADAASTLSAAIANPAPATDANGKDIWGLWASLPGRHDKEVTVVSGSYEDRSAIGNFLLDEGFTVYAD